MRAVMGAALIASVTGLAALSLIGPSARADTVQSDQARATQLSRAIEAQSARISNLANAYDAAQIQTVVLSARVLTARVATEAASRRVKAARAELLSEAVSAYVSGGSDSGVINGILEHSADEAAIRSTYADAVASVQQNVIDQYRNTEEQLQITTSDLAVAQRAAAANMSRLEAAAVQAQAAVAAERTTLALVNGRVAILMAQQAQQAAERRQALAAADLRAEVAVGRAVSTRRGSAGDPAPMVPSPLAPSVPVPTGSAPLSAGGAAAAVAFAEAQVGKPYQWGGAGPDSYDCSGLVMRSWEAGGVSLDHYTVSQYDATTRVSADELQPGDIVFWEFPGEAWPGHDGLYIGNGQVVVADTTGTPVRMESVYYDGNPVGFGRVQ